MVGLRLDFVLQEDLKYNIHVLCVKTCLMCSNKDNIDVSVELTFLFGQVEQEFLIKTSRPPECRVDRVCL